MARGGMSVLRGGGVQRSVFTDADDVEKKERREDEETDF